VITLYRKEGRRYVVLGHAERYDYGDVMKPGTWRLSYCYADGGRRYTYAVKPDTASFVAACELAGEAMEQAIRATIDAHPAPGERPYTREQQEILDKFRSDMTAAGGFLPHWWEYSSARDIAQAGIDAVKNWSEK
jgi:hypothetical protein